MNPCCCITVVRKPPNPRRPRWARCRLKQCGQKNGVPSMGPTFLCLQGSKLAGTRASLRPTRMRPAACAGREFCAHKARIRGRLLGDRRRSCVFHAAHEHTIPGGFRSGIVSGHWGGASGWRDPGHAARPQGTFGPAPRDRFSSVESAGDARVRLPAMARDWAVRLERH
jgi:hypothetical protein